MRKNGVEVQRPWTIRAFKSEGEGIPYPVTVWLEHMKTGVKEIVKSKYLFSAEGARSFVRGQLGVKMRHKDPVSHVWGVMDGVVRTDFPDVKV